MPGHRGQRHIPALGHVAAPGVGPLAAVGTWDWALPRPVLPGSGEPRHRRERGSRWDAEGPKACPHVGAGQVSMGVRTLLALAQRLSPAPTQRPHLQLLGKVPVPFRWSLGRPCPCPVPALGTSSPTGCRGDVPPHGARHSQKHFGVCPAGPLAQQQPHGGTAGWA